VRDESKVKETLRGVRSGPFLVVLGVSFFGLLSGLAFIMVSLSVGASVKNYLVMMFSFSLYVHS